MHQNYAKTISGEKFPKTKGCFFRMKVGKGEAEESHHQCKGNLWEMWFSCLGFKRQIHRTIKIALKVT